MLKRDLPKQDHWPDRRVFVALLPGAAFAFAGCATRPAQPVSYGPTQKLVTYVTRERPGTIVVDPANHFLYSVQKDGQAVQLQQIMGFFKTAGSTGNRNVAVRASARGRSGRGAVRGTDDFSPATARRAA